MDPRIAARALTAATQITTEALTGDDPASVLGAVVRAAAELAEADLALVMVRADDGSVTVEAVHGEPGSALLGARFPPESVAGSVARGGAPVVAADVTTDPRTAPFVPPELRPYGPFAAAPFGAHAAHADDVLLGALTVYRLQGSPEFSAPSVTVLAAFASQAGLVLALSEAADTRHRLTLYQERERIARELHDVIVQRLYGAGMQLDRVRRGMDNGIGGDHADRLADAIDQLDETIQEIRRTVRTLRANEPEKTDIADAVDLAESARAEVRVAGELLGYPPTLELSGELSDIPAERADHVRAALREALSNVVRHSGASTTRVELHRTASEVRLRVRDNGCGVPGGVARRGLRHLEERAEANGGRFSLTSSADHGTQVSFDLPLGAAG